MAELEALSIEIKPDLILLSETWFDEVSVTNIFGYSIHTKKRGKSSDVVCLY